MTIPTAADLALAADHHARLLDAPRPTSPDQMRAGQDLAGGSVGIALAHIERARVGLDGWQRAHAFIQDAVAVPVSEHDTSGLFYGAPALAFVLNAAAGDSDRYRVGLAELDAPLRTLAHRRARCGLDRIAAGKPATFAEYDVFSGLAGIGAVLLRRDPEDSALEQVLTYLVALSEPLPGSDELLPAWWVSHDPHRETPPGYPGHANLGMAHGITGPLALLAQTAQRGITVDGHHQAIANICMWLDLQRRTGATGYWWPEHVPLSELRSGNPASQQGPDRPSWCYGTPGIARAGQLAAIALGDLSLQQSYEAALLACINDDAQLSQLTDPGLCHGWAGTFQTTWRAAADAASPDLRQRISHLAARLLDAAGPADPSNPGLLTGTAGAALALQTAATDTAPTCGWDACLLID